MNNKIIENKKEFFVLFQDKNESKKFIVSKIVLSATFNIEQILKNKTSEIEQKLKMLADEKFKSYLFLGIYYNLSNKKRNFKDNNLRVKIYKHINDENILPYKEARSEKSNFFDIIDLTMFKFDLDINSLK